MKLRSLAVATLVILLVSLVMTGSQGECTIRAVTSHNYYPFNVMLLSDGTWAPAFAETATISDLVSIEVDSIEYFPEDQAANNEYYSVPEHITLKINISNAGSAGISNLTYNLKFSDRFGDSVSPTLSKTSSVEIDPGKEVSVFMYFNEYDLSVRAFQEARDGMLQVVTIPQGVELENGFTFPVDPVPSIPDSGRLAHTESGERVLLFPSYLWDYETPKNLDMKGIVDITTSSVEYFPAGTALLDETYRTEDHVLVTVVVENQSGRPITGFKSQLRIQGSNQYNIENALASQSWVSTDALDPNQSTTLRFIISPPSSQLIQCISRGFLNVFAYIEGISFSDDDAMRAEETCYRDFVCASTLVHEMPE